MYISDKCEWTPYGYDFSLDEKLDRCLKDYKKIINFLEQNKNYGLDMVFNYVNSHHIDDIIYVKQYIVKQGYGLDILVNDKHDSVRKEAAKHGYGLDILVNDEYWYVRKVVAEQGYGLDKLVNDENRYVRAAVAEQGYGLDILINDKEAYVRVTVAEQGYGLDILINDETWEVRTEVAKQGYGLDKLVNDTTWKVRMQVKSYIIDNFNNSLIKWYNENSDKRYYESLHQIFDNQSCSDYCIDLLINDNYFLDYLLKNTDSWSKVREHIIELGYNNITDWMINYPNNVYYTELLKDLPKKSNKKSKTTNKSINNDEVQSADKVSEVEQVTQDFIIKINDSKTLTVSNNIEEFFNSNIDENNNLTIYTVDNKIPIIKINKELKDEKTVFIFNVNIITNNDDNFNFKSTITTKDQLNKLIEQTINALNSYPQFASYIEDLEKCL